MAAEGSQGCHMCTCPTEQDAQEDDNKSCNELDRLAVEAGKQSPVTLSELVTAEEYAKGESAGNTASLAPDSVGSSAVLQKSSKELAKIKKREDKGMEHVMKALQSLESTDEKLSALCKKYAELSEEHRGMQNTLKQTQRTLSVLAREKDQLQNDHSKAVLAKSKLEGLCRELQRHNRLVKEESAQRAKEDDERRKEVASKFQTTINEIQQQMNDHYQKNSALRDENIELTNKLKGLIEQYELREQHIDKIIKHKELEGQLFEAKLSQITLQLSEEKEKSLQEKQMLLQDALENQKKVMMLVENEKQLKAQVTMYQEKYDEFQQTLTKSNDVFQNFKNEMDKMTKKIKKLEKETVMYRQRWEGSNKALLTMAEEKTRSEREVSTLQNKVSKLESLCRALQEERKKFSGLKPTTDLPPVADHHLHGDDCCHGHESASDKPPSYVQSLEPTEGSTTRSSSSPPDGAHSHASGSQTGSAAASDDNVPVSGSNSAASDVESSTEAVLVTNSSLDVGREASSPAATVESDGSREIVEIPTNVDSTVDSSPVAPSGE